MPSLHEAAIELIEVPVRRMTGKNSADMRLCVDAMDMSYSKPHINTFVVVSGDSDFSPLVSKLRENNKQVIGVGMKASTSDLLRDNCDEFIFYEDLTTEAQEAAVQLPDVDDQRKEAFRFLLEALDALTRENRDTLWSSMVKQTIKRKHPQFNENYHGYSSFSKLLEDAEKHKLIGPTSSFAPAANPVGPMTGPTDSRRHRAAAGRDSPPGHHTTGHDVRRAPMPNARRCRCGVGRRYAPSDSRSLAPVSPFPIVPPVSYHAADLLTVL